MREILDIQKQLLPDLMDVMKKRYSILRHILVSGVVGRRTLASSLDMTERVLRGEVDFLKEQGLLETDASGMKISESGRQLLEKMEPLIKVAFGLTDLEERIAEAFGLIHVVVVPGDSDNSSFTKKELGRAGAAALRKFVVKDDVIAVTGGSTMAQVAHHMSISSRMKGSWFVPARGGLGESVDMQANTIASTMAKKTGGKYRLLHVPDHLGEEAYQTLMQDPQIQEVVDVVRKCRIVVHGIGDAMVMARRRKVDQDTTRSLQAEGALAEAFGYYFDRQGNVVHKMPTVGLRLDDIQKTEVVIGVAGGKSKGEAIASVLRHGQEDVLVTDEAAALEMMKHAVSRPS
ncbi:sugar-binding transcriptional regulator [Paenibacillus hexagrammi]|uniref:Sugar-binding domain-containing protein n=1 Tax=Paenibacillus hexagrammi TaxID=2908839 RepID=A0ABY3SHT8_9BACL|nr:sugar-binding domain-containing protein [Paenibacillus sp. YPD9-1]UJF33058.1 sugar-binding domain-containing protein [Paenibacillus sp. YPD9-1]